MFRLEDCFNIFELLKYCCYLYPLSFVSKTHENSLTLFMEIVKCYFRIPKTLVHCWCQKETYLYSGELVIHSTRKQSHDSWIVPSWLEILVRFLMHTILDFKHQGILPFILLNIKASFVPFCWTDPPSSRSH